MTEKQPNREDPSTENDVEKTVLFNNEKTEPHLLDAASEPQQDTDPSIELTYQIEASKESDAPHASAPDLLQATFASGSEEHMPAGTIDHTIELEGASNESTKITSQGAPRKSPTLADVAERTLAGTVDLSGTSDFDLAASDLTIDSASILASPKIDQTINPRDFDESNERDWDRSVGSAPQHGSSAYQPLDRKNITESILSVPARHIAGIRATVEGIPADYEVVKVLGEGGMGTVFLARQTALDRLVALKVVKDLGGDQAKRLAASGKLEQVNKSRRDQFLAEAVVTGDLDHPNIVPIHDLAVAREGTLFYAMKKVDGTPWSKVIREKSQDENLEILLKVCDAIAFAHSRGIVHRDIKPENVMLGDFGVVLLMDWGLAVPKETYAKRGTIYQTTSLGGSPAYMAPEMVVGPVEAIGPPSDIYLLGATLFEIIVGRPPHIGKNVSECIQSVTKNVIIDAPISKRGELLQIALRAMATNTSDRYRSVGELQDAIRQYRSHAESILLTVRAEEDLELAKKSAEYNDHARSLFGFEEAYKLWEGNTRAEQGLQLAKLAYAETALLKEDFDLGLSLLDSNNETHHPVITKLLDGKHERESRLRRLAWLKRTAAGLIAFIFIGGGGALYQISKDRDRARVAEKAADAEATEANRQRTIAESKTVEAQENLLLAIKNEKTALANAQEAERQRGFAEDQRMIAVQKAAEAQRERRNAEYETYVAQIGLAKARIDQNEFDDARRILIDLRSKLGENEAPSWEWQWLWNQANQSQDPEAIPDSARSLSLSSQKTRAAVISEDGTVHLFRLNGQQGFRPEADAQINSIVNATAAAISPDETQIAVADPLGTIHLWDVGSGKSRTVLVGHSGQITALTFVDHGRLLSASRDRSVRLWNLADASELASCWHIGPVVDVACNSGGTQKIVVAAVADDRSGRVVAWELSGSATKTEFLRRADFLEHKAPVLAVAISADGESIASGDRTGRVLLWSLADTDALDYGDAISAAIEKLNSDNAQAKAVRAATPFRELHDLSESRPLRLISINQHNEAAAHRDTIKSLRFNSQGTNLLSASDDYTIKVWDVASGALAQTLKGHGGWVQGADFSGPDDMTVLSASSDATVRSWQLASLQDTSPYRNKSPESDKLNPHRDEIWSARFDASGTRVVTASRDHTAMVLEIDQQTLRFKPIASLEEEKPQSLHEGSAFVALSQAFDLKHNRLFVGSADSVVRIWNLDSGTESASVSGTGLNTVMAVSPDGNLLVTGSSSPDAQALVWDVSVQNGDFRTSPRLLHKLSGHQAAVTAIAISNDSERLFTADRNGVGILWNAQSGKPEKEKFVQHQGTRVNAAAFHPNGSDLLLAGDNQQVSWIELKQRKTLRNFAHDGFVTKLAIAPDGASFATINEYTVDKETTSALTVWEFESDEGVGIQRVRKTAKGKDGKNAEMQTERLPEGRMLSVVYDTNGGIVACRSDEEAGRITVWQPNSESVFSVKHALKLPATLPECAEAISAGNHRLLSLNGDAAFLWDLKTMNHIRSFRAHGGVSEANFSSDGKFVITASRSIRIWDVATAKSLHKLEFPHAGLVHGVEFSPLPDDYRFASAGADGVVKLWQWNPKTLEAKQLRSFPATESNLASVNRVRFSPDGQYLLAVDDSGVARIWDVEGEEPVREFRDEAGKTAFLCGAFSRDGRWIAVGCSDRQARIWQVPGKHQEQREPMIVLQGHADQIEDIRFLGNAAEALRVLTGSRDKSARIWDPRFESGTGQGREIISLRRHSLGITAVDVTDDGKLLLTGSRDGSVILWPAVGQEQ